MRASARWLLLLLSVALARAARSRLNGVFGGPVRGLKPKRTASGIGHAPGWVEGICKAGIHDARSCCVRVHVVICLIEDL